MIEFGKGDRPRPVDKDKFNKNYDEIFRKKNDKTKNNTKKNR
jgi:hypothetical protein